MILTQESVTVEGTHIRKADKKVMSLKVGPELFAILTKNLYANPVLASQNEANQNAWDSHQRAGCGDRPFHVQLPSHFDPRYVIRDFGVGMSHEFMMNDYCIAGQSSKSQDAAQSGGWGLGRLSGLALSTTYNVACYDGNEKRTYAIFINGDGIPEVNRIATAPSKEERGVEITIPVNAKDINSFPDACRESCRFYPVKPIVKGVAGFLFHENQVTLKGDGWFIDKSIGFPVAVGGVYWYRLEPDNITGLTDEQKDLLNSSLGLVLSFDPSSVSPQANRQGLHYNDATCAAIKARLATLESEVKAVVQSHFDKCASIIEAKRLWLDYFKPAGSAWQLGRVFGTKQTVTWQGHVIDSADLTILQPDPLDNEKLRGIPGIVLTAYTIRMGRRGHRSVTQDSTFGTMHVSAKNRLFLNDLDGGRGIKRRVGYELMQDASRLGDNYLHYYAIHFKTPAAQAAFHAVNHTTPADMALFSPASAIIVPASVHVGGDRNLKHKLKVFRFDRSGSDRKSDSWEPTEIDEDEGGIYTTIFRFENTSISNGMIAARLAILRKHGVIKDGTAIYGIKTGEYGSNAPAILATLQGNEDWIDLSKWFAEKREEILPAADIGTLLADAAQNDSSPLVSAKTVPAFNGTALGDYLDKKLFIVGQVDKAKAYEDTMSDYVSLGGAKTYTNNAKATYDMAKEWKRVLAAYPLLAKFSGYSTYAWDKGDIRLAADYVALIEAAAMRQTPYPEAEVAA